MAQEEDWLIAFGNLPQGSLFPTSFHVSEEQAHEVIDSLRSDAPYVRISHTISPGRMQALYVSIAYIAGIMPPPGKT